MHFYEKQATLPQLKLPRFYGGRTADDQHDGRAFLVLEDVTKAQYGTLAEGLPVHTVREVRIHKFD